MRYGKKLTASVVLVGILLTVTGTVWAEEPAERGVVRGQVARVERDTLLVNTASGEEVRVVTTEDTRLRIPGVREPSLEDVDVGDYVGAWGERNEDGDLLARAVAVLPAEQAHRRNVVQGRVTAIDGLTLTVSTSQGEQIVITGEETRFRVPGVEDPGLAGISVGDPILALGRPDEEGNLLAKVVAVVSAPQLKRHTIRGLVAGVEGDTLNLTTRRGEIRVLTDEETHFRIPGVEDPGIADLELRDLVLVVGTWDPEEEVFTARAVTLIPRWPSHLRFIRGEVTAIEGRNIVLDAMQGEVAVLTDGDTIFRIPGVEDPGLEDVEVGDTVGMLVSRLEDGEGGLLAKVVVVPKAVGSFTDVFAAPIEAATALLEDVVQQAEGS